MKNAERYGTLKHELDISNKKRNQLEERFAQIEFRMRVQEYWIQFVKGICWILAGFFLVIGVFFDKLAPLLERTRFLSFTYSEGFGAVQKFMVILGLIFLCIAGVRHKKK